MLRYVAGVIVGISVAVAGVASAQALGLSEREALNRARAGVAKTGHSSQIITTTNASVGPLVVGAVYEIVCTEDTYFEWGETAPTANSDSSYLPADTIIYRTVGDSIRYMSAIKVSTNGVCYLTELE
jgi:hypothetical protein